MIPLDENNAENRPNDALELKSEYDPYTGHEWLLVECSKCHRIQKMFSEMPLIYCECCQAKIRRDKVIKYNGITQQPKTFSEHYKCPHCGMITPYEESASFIVCINLDCGRTIELNHNNETDMEDR